MRVTIVFDGKQAVDYILTNKDAPALILMDVQMPIMDGLEATNCIREWEGANGFKRVPIVALTANAYDEDIKNCKSSGMDDFLPKPVSLAVLEEKMRKWLG